MNPLLSQIVARFGTPCFVYDFDQIQARVDAVRQAFAGRLKISYAMKANPNGEIVRRMRNVVDFLDISSGGELRKAIECGWDAGLLSFTGPGKRDFELESAICYRTGAVVLESVGEARRLDQFAAQAKLRQPVLIRISPARIPPGFGINMAGKPCQFGIDEEDLDPAIAEIKSMANLDLVGFHAFAGTQCLKADVIASAYETYMAVFQKACTSHDLRPTKLVFGSGLGIPYHEQDRPLDLPAVAAKASSSLDKLRADARFEKTELILETGRYLVGEAGVYLTRVVSKKCSRGAAIRICDGGMNHHLGAAGHLGAIIHRNYRIFKLGAEDQPGESAYDLFGPLCTSIDMLAHGVRLPALDVGDVIGIQCSGAYGLTASPTRFISHPPPKEVLVQTRGGAMQAIDISAAG
jgi:diaminopimelate decarboxylase